jgi:serine/threonine-protein kinase
MTDSFPSTLIAYQSPEIEGLTPGQMIDGRYRLDEPVGEGSFGAVWRATHVLMKKRVAIKFLHAALERHDDALDRFRREAQAAANIANSHVCSSTDFGQTDSGDLFLVMEYLDGVTLGDLLEDVGRLEPHRVIELGAQLADGLHAAHALGVTHLDLKPDNIMLLQVEGRDLVKIMDFGIARVPREVEEITEQDGVKHTLTRRIHGTPGYMAPEQIVDAPLGPPADLYALGVVLYELLSGQLPFDSEDIVALLGMHLREPVPPLSRVVPNVDIPDGLTAVIMRLLEKRPELRFESAAHVRDALRAMSAASSQPRTVAQPSVASQNPIRHVTRGLEAIGAPPWAFAAVVAALVTAVLMAAVIITAAVVAKTTVAHDDDDEDTPAAHANTPASPQSDSPTNAPDDTPNPNDPLDIARDKVQRRPAVLAATEQLATGDIAKAIAALEALVQDEPDNAHLHYLLAIAHSRDKKHAASLAAYIAASRIDVRYANENNILDEIPGALRNAKISELEPLSTYLKEQPNDAWIDLVVKTSIADTNARARRNARDVLQAADLWSTRPKWEHNAFTLWGVEECSVVARLAKSLGDDGDANALPVLRSWSRKPTKGCGFLKRKDCYECARSTLSSAQRKIKQRAQTPITDSDDDAPED